MAQRATGGGGGDGGSGGGADDVVVVGSARTAMGSFGGALAQIPAPELGGTAIKAALARAGVDPGHVDEVFMGNVVSAGLGQAPARQAALHAGLPVSCPCTTVNKMCASGLKAVMLGAQSIVAGGADVVVCGGFENMSRAPFYSSETRFGRKFGDVALVDGLAHDGLRDAYSGEEMGRSAALCAVEHGISREEQDAYAAQSYERAGRAIREGKLAAEVTPVLVRRKGRAEPEPFAQDEEPLARRVDVAALTRLPPAFALPRSAPRKFASRSEARSVTAGNSSTVSDGAACVVLARRSFAREHGLRILARLDGWADAAGEPEQFPVVPAAAMQLALARAGMPLSAVDLFEINEAFSVVPLVNMRLLGLPADRVNVYGGAVSMGHPIGASGCRILCTMLSALEQEDRRTGCLGICNGGGGASALVVTREPSPASSTTASRL